jgi:hypothetical protein
VKKEAKKEKKKRKKKLNAEVSAELQDTEVENKDLEDNRGRCG